MGRDRSSALVARLRAYQQLPAGIPVRVQSATTRPDGTRIAWRILNAVTGEPVGVESRHPLGVMLAAREWAFRLDGGVTIAEPGGPETSSERNA